jgi:hypothetical protein
MKESQTRPMIFQTNKKLFSNTYIDILPQVEASISMERHAPRVTPIFEPARQKEKAVLEQRFVGGTDKFA